MNSIQYISKKKKKRKEKNLLEKKKKIVHPTIRGVIRWMNERVFICRPLQYLILRTGANSIGSTLNFLTDFPIQDGKPRIRLTS